MFKSFMIMIMYIQPLWWATCINEINFVIRVFQINVLKCRITSTLVGNIAIFIRKTFLGVRVWPINMIVLFLLNKLKLLTINYSSWSKLVWILWGCLNSNMKLIKCSSHNLAIAEALQVQYHSFVEISCAKRLNFLVFKCFQKKAHLIFVLYSFYLELVISKLLCSHKIDINKLGAFYFFASIIAL